MNDWSSAPSLPRRNRACSIWSWYVKGTTVVRRVGERIDGVNFLLRPTVNFLVDPIIQAIAPETKFVVEPGAPPALARFEGPRNYARQKIRIE